MVASFRRYTKCSQDLEGLRPPANTDGASGFFKWSDGLVLYGRSHVGAPYLGTVDQLADVTNLFRRSPKDVTLPFCLDDVSTNLRLEKYARNQDAATQSGVSIKTALHDLYYRVRPLLPVGLRKHLQRVALSGWDKIAFPKWPVDCTVETLMKHVWRVLLELHGATELPFIWFWPEDYSAAGMMTHDVETAAGRDFCGRIMEIEESSGVRSSFELFRRSATKFRLHSWTTFGATAAKYACTG